MQTDFWNNGEAAQSVLRKISTLEKSVKSFEKAARLSDDAKTLLDLAEEDEGEELGDEITQTLEEFDKSIENLEFNRMLGGKEDMNNAIVSINPGAGGTESQDWASMLLRMYERWATDKGFDSAILDRKSTV